MLNLLEVNSNRNENIPLSSALGRVLAKDIETLFSVVENPLNFTISDKVKEEQAVYDEKQRQTKEAEIQSVVEDNVEGKILTETEINTKQKKLESLKIKLDTVNLEIMNNEKNAKPEIEIVDKDGTFVPTAGNTIKFKIDGPGKLVGVDNGNPLSHESFKGNQRSAFNGLCLATVQSTLSSGQITVIAESEGLVSCKLIISVD